MRPCRAATRAEILLEIARLRRQIDNLAVKVINSDFDRPLRIKPTGPGIDRATAERLRS